MKRLSRGAKKLGRSKLGKRVRKGLLKVAKDVAIEMIKSGGDTEKMKSTAGKSALKETGKVIEGKGRLPRGLRSVHGHAAHRAVREEGRRRRRMAKGMRGMKKLR
tara:strand:+ start:892 stop:1206 length:315 start_codon:yes stop_codon:yes gene_type:complete